MPPIPRRLACSETWASKAARFNCMGVFGAGGARSRWRRCSLSARLPSCIVSRMALAGVSGHGQTVAVFGERLRELMQRYLLDLEQIAMLRDLNQVVRAELGGGHYATMVAVGFHGRRGLAVMTNAGHPPPPWHRASRGEWSWLETNRDSEREQRVGLPLGLFDDITYDRLVLKPRAGDFLLLCSDGVCESKSPAGIELARDGQIDMVRTLDSSAPESLGTQLASALCAFRGNTEPVDDEYLTVLSRSSVEEKQPKRTLVQ
jgi:phosphoserine phosphatase RsbU/P